MLARMIPAIQKPLLGIGIRIQMQVLARPVIPQHDVANRGIPITIVILIDSIVFASPRPRRDAPMLPAVETGRLQMRFRLVLVEDVEGEEDAGFLTD